MYNRSYRWHVGFALAASTCLAVLMSLIGAIAWQRSDNHQFMQAWQHWQSNPVPRYRLVIERPLLWCQQDVAIRNERIVDVLQNDCPIESLTVSTLFQRIAQLDGRATEYLFPIDVCTCHSELNASVVYDETYAYPAEVTIIETRRVDWQEPACWRMLVAGEQLPDCELPVAMAQPRITTISLIPLP